MEIIQYACDVCESIKGEGNRWLVGWKIEHGYALADWPNATQDSSFDHTFCGEKCALKHQGSYLRRDVEAVAAVTVPAPDVEEFVITSHRATPSSFLNWYVSRNAGGAALSPLFRGGAALQEWIDTSKYMAAPGIESTFFPHRLVLRPTTSLSTGTESH